VSFSEFILRLSRPIILELPVTVATEPLLRVRPLPRMKAAEKTFGALPVSPNPNPSPLGCKAHSKPNFVGGVFVRMTFHARSLKTRTARRRQRLRVVPHR
jgi:hypothetical protein